MKFFAELPLSAIAKINYNYKILLIGSCFSSQMEQHFKQAGFTVMSNPLGIMYSPMALLNTVMRCVRLEFYKLDQLFEFNEIWNSWDHHSQFSHRDPQQALDHINEKIVAAHRFLKSGPIIVIHTWGTAYQYFLKATGQPVANNHKAPSSWFERKMLSVEEIAQSATLALSALQQLNPQVDNIATISPVRHIREGLVNNNRSKARLIDAVHQVAERGGLHYFPAYELVNDVLRDYRFYENDFAHPTSAAIAYVWDKFKQVAIDPQILPGIMEAESIFRALMHRERFPDTNQHKQFLARVKERIAALTRLYPAIQLSIN